MTLDAHLGLSLRYARLKKGLSLRDAALAIGKSHTFLARIERHDLSVTEDTLAMLNDLYGTTLTADRSVLADWVSQMDAVLESYLNGDFLSFEAHKKTMLEWENPALKSPIYLDHAVASWVIDVHLHAANRPDMIEKAKLFEPLVHHIQGSLRWLSVMTLFRVALHDWRLNDAQAFLHQARTIISHPHYKAVIDLADAEMNFHRYNRQGALRINEKAKQTFSFFNNYLRMAIAEVRGALYARRQLTSDRLEYGPLKEKATTFHLPELASEVAMVEALRALHLHAFDFAIDRLSALNQDDPQIYFYTAMALHKKHDDEGLKAHLKTAPKSYAMPEIFQFGIDYLNAHLENKSARHTLDPLQRYFERAIQENLYGETRWAERELRMIYEKNRQYKAATLMIERITQTIMKP